MFSSTISMAFLNRNVMVLSSKPVIQHFVHSFRHVGAKMFKVTIFPTCSTQLKAHKILRAIRRRRLAYLRWGVGEMHHKQNGYQVTQAGKPKHQVKSQQQRNVQFIVKVSDCEALK